MQEVPILSPDVAAKLYPHPTPRQSYFCVSYDTAKRNHLAITKSIAYQNSNFLSIFLSI